MLTGFGIGRLFVPIERVFMNLKKTLFFICNNTQFSEYVMTLWARKRVPRASYGLPLPRQLSPEAEPFLSRGDQ
jgi:hypothetical protein